MDRQAYHELLNWKQSKLRKPLLLRGARQVGKTYLLQQFAKNEYQDYIFINFDEERHFSEFFDENLSPERILKDLSLYFKKSILPGKTLLIFDEIQECPNALNSLKYFCEKNNEYHIAAAGSLLGVKLTQGFPVGKVNFIDVKPLSFFEFLDALDEKPLCELLQTKKNLKAIINPFHERLVKLLKHYLVIGGMPEAVANYREYEDFFQVRKVQRAILDAYTLDFAKHAPKEDVMRIMRVWDIVPAQLAKENKKFMFSAISKSARAREYASSLRWLIDVGLVTKVNLTSVPKLPLKAYAESQIFKIYLLDVGLLGAMSDLDPRIILEGNRLFEEFKGSLTENFVAQELSCKVMSDMYYWTSASAAEVDFIIAMKQRVFPLEVKAGGSIRNKSLLAYGEKYSADKYHGTILSRTSIQNFAHDGGIVNYPLYAVSLFPLLPPVSA